MVMLINPAPGGRRGLEYGNTTVRPYNKSRPHRGQDWEREWRDLAKPRPVVTPAGGRVTRVWSDGKYNDGWGNRVEITVPSASHRVVVALNHFETGTIRVREGQEVRAGDYIGEMGATGETAGVHLHEELWINGDRVNPNTYRVTDLPGTGFTPPGGAPASTGKGQPIVPAEIEDEEEIDMFTIVIGQAWYLCIPKSGGGFHAVARPGDVDRYQSEGNKRVPVYNFTSADAGIRGELRRVITGLPS